MKDKQYNILWIDDEHEKLNAIHRTALDYGIKLFPYKSLNGGISELERNSIFYDGILLDAKFFENEDDVKGTEDVSNSYLASQKIGQLQEKKFEIFVLTGQAEAFGDTTYKKVFKNVFRKGIDEDEDALFEAIIAAANQQENTQIRHQFQRVFDVCTERYLGEYAGQDLMTLLKGVEEDSTENYFNTMRKILEDLLQTFNKYQLLPNEFISPSIAINPSCKFLAGKKNKQNYYIEKEFKHLDETHLPPQIASMLFNICSATQNGSHRLEIDGHIKYLRTPYFFRSVLYQLLDVLIWFKLYVDSEPKANNWLKEGQNNATKNTTKRMEGKVIGLDTYKGFAFFKKECGGPNIFIPPNIVSKYKLQNNMDIIAESEEYNDRGTNELKSRIKCVEVK